MQHMTTLNKSGSEFWTGVARCLDLSGSIHSRQIRSIKFQSPGVRSAFRVIMHDWETIGQDLSAAEMKMIEPKRASGKVSSGGLAVGLRRSVSREKRSSRKLRGKR